MARLLWSQEKCPPESALLLGSRLRGAAESHYPALASELENQNGNTSAPSTKQPVAALDFTMSRVLLSELSTNKMKAELLHLFMQPNCLEQHQALWRLQ